ncbi:MAG: redoxin domain-containing protein [Sphingomonadales bacterium]|nr:redoxin domain-containing protein [Sphingomonadales bacterium]NCQ20930.1 redoxin domain-containing protein [Sphingomonadales bacterium]NCT02687.1 redoxin domain-containing protein [Sphingomonadales bacterium]
MLKPDQPVPALDLPLTIGARYDLSKQHPEHFTMLVFYRGKHCPICRSYLEELGGKLEDFVAAGVNVAAVSMDNEDRAMVAHNDWKTGDVPLVYGLTEDQARAWGLYISQGRDDSGEPSMFSEPGLFLIRPDGRLYFASIQNAPFTRPPLDQLLEGISFVTEKGYPVRGTLT